MSMIWDKQKLKIIKSNVTNSNKDEVNLSFL